MKIAVLGTFIIATAVVGSNCAIIEPNKFVKANKIFNYQGAMLIKDDRTGELIRNEPNETEVVASDDQQNVSEAECWTLIVERSDVTFALQSKVLDELEDDLKDSELSPEMRRAITKLSIQLRDGMQEGLDALKSGSAEEYFESLFEVSETIITMSGLIRDPKLDEKVFLALVKAVSRLGRNNGALVQEFMDKCAIARDGPKPRILTSVF